MQLDGKALKTLEQIGSLIAPVVSQQFVPLRPKTLFCRNGEKQRRIRTHLANKVMQEGTIILLMLKDVEQRYEAGADDAIRFSSVGRLTVTLSKGSTERTDRFNEPVRGVRSISLQERRQHSRSSTDIEELERRLRGQIATNSVPSQTVPEELLGTIKLMLKVCFKRPVQGSSPNRLAQCRVNERRRQTVPRSCLAPERKV